MNKFLKRRSSRSIDVNRIDYISHLPVEVGFQSIFTQKITTFVCVFRSYL